MPSSPPPPSEESFLSPIEAQARKPTELGSWTDRTKGYADLCERRAGDADEFELRSFVVRRDALRIDVASLFLALMLVCGMVGVIRESFETIIAAIAFAAAIIAPSFRSIATSIHAAPKRDR